MNEILLLLLGFLLLPYLFVPIMIRRNQFFSEKPQLRPVITGFLPSSVEKYFVSAGENLKLLGFEHRVDAISLDYGPSLRVFIRFFVETRRSILATCTSILPDGAKTPVGNFLEFNSRFSDGREVSTHNSDLFGAPIEPRQKTILALPFVKETAVLFGIHNQILDRLHLKEKKSLIPDAGAEFDFLVKSFKEDLIRQMNLGCLEFDQATNCYRPTWAGAFLMGWYSMWPITSIRRLLHRLKAKIKIKALNKASA